MSTTLTVRTDDALRDALSRRAVELGITVSEVVREILEAELVDRPLGERIGAIRGGLTLVPDDGDGWRRRIRERNWRS